ncbi:ParB/RepB/Spo0J family partition protein [Glutamicibacter halophytocola]|uniref:ParB/RepB/Spo0J family partition protein n=1 Tax=Glutamicibacter halophytocola TaxID=1933880 RepID=A0AA94Y1A4_9MICC|nr:ParB/RepB/Spo0J family partition protein [Glutamicibacter halophytocola]UUX60140.1 ParB/RepB/Spo0J family partition protein [Glutamicibacter halophytocola]
MSQKPGQLKMLPISAVHPDPKNPRTDMGDLDQLAHELKSIGQMDAITVYPHPERDGDYQIQGGHRRHAAALRAGLTELKCEVIPTPANAAMDLYTEALSTGTNHLQLDYLGQSQALQGLLTEGKSEAWIAKNFKIDKAEVKPRARLASQPKVAKLHERGTIDLLTAADILDVETETGDGSLFESVVDELESTRWKQDQRDVTRLIEQKKANAKRDLLRAELTAQDAVEIDSENRYSGKWSKTEAVLSVEEHIKAGHQFDVSTPESVNWWAKTKSKAKQVSPERKAELELVRKLNGTLPTSKRARQQFVVSKIQDKKALSDAEDRELFTEVVLAADTLTQERKQLIAQAINLPLPEPENEENAWDESFRKRCSIWEEQAYDLIFKLTLGQQVRLYSWLQAASAEDMSHKTNLYQRDSWEKAARWKPMATWYNRLIRYFGYVPDRDEVEAMRWATDQDSQFSVGFEVELPAEAEMVCGKCGQQSIAPGEHAGECPTCDGGVA